MHTAPSLLECQRRFLAALYDHAEPGPLEQIAGARLEPAARLRIYRHSSAIIHTETLRTAFPAVAALVGEAFFEQVSTRYRRVHPSQSGNLQGFGAHFADFLGSLPEAQGVPYLGDVARLEWLRQQAALAADAGMTDGSNFQHALCDAGNQTRLVPHTSLRLLASRHAVLTIWQYAMNPIEESLSLPDRGENVVLWRDGTEVAMAALDDASFACVHALSQGDTFGVAIAAASKIDPAFDSDACIASLAQHGLIGGFE